MSFAFHIHVPALVAGKRFVLFPLHTEGTSNAFSGGCEQGRPEESGRRELLKREHVLNQHFASLPALGRDSYMYSTVSKAVVGRTKSRDPAKSLYNAAVF